MEHDEYDVLHSEGGRPIKMWTHGVPVEAAGRHQLVNTAKMPFIYKHIAVMPDVHLGKGSTIGSVIPTLGAIEKAVPHGLSPKKARQELMGQAAQAGRCSMGATQRRVWPDLRKDAAPAPH